MMIKKTATALLLAIFLWNTASSQVKNKTVTLHGYISSLQSVVFDSLSGPFQVDNLLHNRLNFRGYISDRITLAAEFRNRLFTGDLVRLGSFYSDLIGFDPGFVDMSWNLASEQSFLINTKVDRLWLDLHYDKFEVTLGRQRINWGQTIVWNPNDIFNAYSFFDFDYIERPGCDAVRVQVFPSPSSVTEVAVKVDNMNDVTASALYRFNKWSYDFQFLAGYFNSEDVVVGVGWSGAIGSVSFRGEGSWFEPFEEFPVSTGTLIFTTGIDKIFKDNSVAQFQVMYCNNPLKLNNFNSLYSGDLSARDLAFSRFTAFGLYTWAVTPLLNLTLSAMWFPDLSGYFAGPSLDYSLSENVDFSLYWQHFNSIISGERTRLNLGFLRVKYSF
ncbi:MAG: hypothetical protein WCE64_02295 [Bacteroidales bacterium]